MLPASSKPYLVQAVYEWCVDQGYTPYIVVSVDEHCRVPQAYVRNGDIVFNIGPNAVKSFMMDREWIGFSARFNGVAQEVSFPIAAVSALYARETGEGMGFEVSSYKDKGDSPENETEEVSQDSAETTSSGKKPKFSLVD